MVNLRYHVVSLIAVFLALAVGVVLGAGPLQNQINTAGQGADLQEQVDELEEDLSLADSKNDEYSEYVRANADEILPGTLDDRALVIVAFPGSQLEHLQSVQDAAETAGANVVGTVQLTSNWVSQGQREYRETLSTPISTHLISEEDPGSAEAVLSQGLLEVLTTSGPEADLLKEILADGSNALVEGATIPTEKADSVILVGPGEPLVLHESDDQEQSEGSFVVSETAVLALADALSKFPDGSVVVGSATDEADLVTILREESSPVTTVDQIDSAMGPVNAALALTTTKIGAYGQGIGATDAVAPVK